MRRSELRLRARARVAAVAAALAVDCSSGAILVSPQPGDGARLLGRATGTACGSLLLVVPVPVLLGARVERAYRRALASVPGATGLTNVTVAESWYYWYLGRTHCMTLEGDAVG